MIFRLFFHSVSKCYFMYGSELFLVELFVTLSRCDILELFIVDQTLYQFKFRPTREVVLLIDSSETLLKYFRDVSISDIAIGKRPVSP